MSGSNYSYSSINLSGSDNEEKNKPQISYEQELKDKNNLLYAKCKELTKELSYYKKGENRK